MQEKTSNQIEQAPIPASWNIGSFHSNSRLYQTYLQKSQHPAIQNNSKPQGGESKQVRPPSAIVGSKGRISTADRIASEDYFRVLKENKEVAKSLKSKQNQQKVPGFESISKISKYSPNKETEDEEDFNEEEMVNKVELPEETMYLIDKVVRQRARVGPIGVDNSELINIEIENEFKERNQYIQNLVEGNKGEESTDPTQSEDKENKNNNRLMQRLTQAANHAQSQFGQDKSKMTSVMESKSKIGEKSGVAVSHEEWFRRKEHETKLKEQLVLEAKKDLVEQMKIKKVEEVQKNQEKQIAMLQWEDRKKQEEYQKKMEKYHKEERQRIQKQIKQEHSYKVFKEWLKKSLIKQREDMLQKKIRDQHKKEMEEKEKKAKANMKVMAKIAYKEWKENKREEARQRAKLERLERRQRMMEQDDQYQDSRQQKGEVLLAYGLNKNLRNLQSRPKSAKPVKRNKRKNKHGLQYA